MALGQISGKFRPAVKDLAGQEQIPFYSFTLKERKDAVANSFRFLAIE